MEEAGSRSRVAITLVISLTVEPTRINICRWFAGCVNNISTSRAFAALLSHELHRTIRSTALRRAICAVAQRQISRPASRLVHGLRLKTILNALAGCVVAAPHVVAPSCAARPGFARNPSEIDIEC